jgi:hypothetical protein
MLGAGYAHRGRSTSRRRRRLAGRPGRRAVGLRAVRRPDARAGLLRQRRRSAGALGRRGVRARDGAGHRQRRRRAGDAARGRVAVTASTPGSTSGTNASNRLSPPPTARSRRPGRAARNPRRAACTSPTPASPRCGRPTATPACAGYAARARAQLHRPHARRRRVHHGRRDVARAGLHLQADEVLRAVGRGRGRRRHADLPGARGRQRDRPRVGAGRDGRPRWRLLHEPARRLPHLGR